MPIIYTNSGAASKTAIHDDVHYNMPVWATCLTRDSATSLAIYWELPPYWSSDYGYVGKHRDGSDYKWGYAAIVNPKKPDGNFSVEV